MGKMHLNLYHTVWPSWVSSKKYEKLKNNEESSSWMLARSLSLKRANERAKSYQRNGGDDENGSQHRLSESIDALFVLSQLKEYGSDWFRYDDSCRGEQERELWRDDDRKATNGSNTSVGKDNTSGLEMKGNYLDDTKDLKLDNEENREICRENDKKDSNGPWAEELASVKSEGSSTNSGPEMDGHELENGGVKFEDKKIVSAVEEETRSSSMDDRRSRRVPDSLSACLPSEIFSTSVKESVALVKHSFNPYKDFRDSMMEMILASSIDFNNSDLEELLYCYFSLNSPEHHDLIKKAFMDIWLELQAV